ncbi:LysR family transcriptional regulator [Spongiibacter tropicus]|uniref:LysR family transcriptional regulator n=1 Tax=Spongiibacter tropicus TaxID=454602 RepID=UPI0035BE486A
MNLSRIDLNLFVVFDAIYSHQSLTRAAGVLHVTQPAVSNALARLRNTLDDPLFVRGPSGMSPTPLARQLITPVREALRELDQCVHTRMEFNAAEARQTFRIHATEHAEIFLLPSLLKHLQDHAPGIDLEVVFMRRKEIPLALASGELQLAIDAPLINSSELLYRSLRSDHYVCVMRNGHPLIQGELTLERFLSARHIHISSRSRGSGHVDLALRSIGQQRRIALRLQHHSGLPGLLHNSDYIAAVPKTQALRMGWQQRPLPFDCPPLELNIYWHKNADHEPSIHWLRDRLEACVDADSQ